MTMKTQVLMLQLPAGANDNLTVLAWVTISQVEGDISLHPIPITVPSIYPQGSPAVLGLQETVQWVTQRARATLNDQRETARRAMLHQQDEFLAATHQYEAVARQNLASANFYVQMQVRQLEEAFSRLSHRLRELVSRFSQEPNQALEEQREK